jgi:hypothetical protein
MKFTVLLVMSLFISAASTASAADAPYSVQAAIFAKIIGFNKSLSGNITIYIMGSDEMKSKLSKAIGKKSGGAIIKSIESGAGLPTSKPHILYIDKSAANAEEALKYCTDNGVMSITGSEDLVTKGASLGLTIVGGKPKILLGTKGTKNEKIKWNPVIFKLAKKV